ncbi:hypothetical protein VIGAN_01445900 [Vigna angularis var. angularis]|uniref:Uncharacterized protein n=1 Tax=Vigna angularis var. angularis TaxID=157739 RepID=A0A0S3R7B8_PHAAN|nr:hypothetical protein VIGAN_01445900 [Vigna angularis var. angularis]
MCTSLSAVNSRQSCCWPRELDTRRILKRLAKENLKQLGRMVAKLAHANPMTVLQTIVHQLGFERIERNWKRVPWFLRDDGLGGSIQWTRGCLQRLKLQKGMIEGREQNPLLKLVRSHSKRSAKHVEGSPPSKVHYRRLCHTRRNTSPLAGTVQPKELQGKGRWEMLG